MIEQLAKRLDRASKVVAGTLLLDDETKATQAAQQLVYASFIADVVNGTTPADKPEHADMLNTIDQYCTLIECQLPG